MPVLFLLTGPDKRESWRGGADLRPAPLCQLSRLSGQRCGNTAPKTVKISNFGQKFVLFKNNSVAHGSQGFVRQSSRNMALRVEQPSVLNKFLSASLYVSKRGAY